MKINKIQIAIDSPAASGAGTQAKLLAKHYNLLYLDTGKLYRIVAKVYLEKNKKINYAELKKIINQTKLKDLKSKKLIKSRISMVAAKLAKNYKIRKFVSDYQIKLANNPPKKYKGVCFDGRDITYKIMPKANIKFFLTAKIKERARRRFVELKKLKHSITYNEVLKDIKERDKSDFSRKISPLKIVDDAIYIDNSNMTIKKCFNLMVKEINKKIIQ
tara:strand:+ start:1181 stop:1831 length:651 start_codon:yes stop_codon:yes gene_type:complete